MEPCRSDRGQRPRSTGRAVRKMRAGLLTPWASACSTTRFPTCKRIRVLHLILDNGSTHAPQQLAAWILSLRLRFEVHVHWLPVHASWLDQIEIVFGVLQRKVLMPNDFASTDHVERRILRFLAERNRTARPIHWSYTSKQLMAGVGRRHRLAAS
jgi:hypothetical protein